MQETKIRDIEELSYQIANAWGWEEFDQLFIAAAIGQWRACHKVFVEAEEHCERTSSLV